MNTETLKLYFQIKIFIKKLKYMLKYIFNTTNPYKVNHETNGKET